MRHVLVGLAVVVALLLAACSPGALAPDTETDATTGPGTATSPARPSASARLVRSPSP